MASPVTTSYQLKSWFADAMKAKMRRQAAELLNDAGNHGVDIMQDNAPVRTGALRDDLQVIKEATPDDLQVVMGSTDAVPYTFFQEVGWGGRPGKYFIRKGHQAAIAYVKNGIKRIHP